MTMNLLGLPGCRFTQIATPASYLGKCDVFRPSHRSLGSSHAVREWNKYI